MSAPLDVFLVAGESSGDALGASLMDALRRKLDGNVAFRGVGGAGMEAQGLVSTYPMEDLTAIGIGAVVQRLPLILRRLRETVEAIVAAPPAVLVLIDAQDFTQRVAARVRRRLPQLPIVKYVSPTVWVWRAGRAAAMRGIVDAVLAVLPFEPALYRRLGGPPCIYVGHPLLERLGDLRPNPAEAERRNAEPPLVLALPGSRRQEVRRLGAVFGETLGRVAAVHGPLRVVVPTVARLADDVRTAVARWPIAAEVASGQAEKNKAFREAHVALAASGTVTLELALAGVPQITAYRIPTWEGWIGRLVIGGKSVILANWVLGRNVVPEFLQDACSPEQLGQALLRLLGDTPERRQQLQELQRIDEIMSIGKVTPSEKAADMVVAAARDRRALRHFATAADGEKESAIVMR
jgi:lipid-A-disaccharide synthase